MPTSHLRDTPAGAPYPRLAHGVCRHFDQVGCHDNRPISATTCLKKDRIKGLSASWAPLLHEQIDFLGRVDLLEGNTKVSTGRYGEVLIVQRGEEPPLASCILHPSIALALPRSP